MEEIREAAKNEVEPVGTPPDETSDEEVKQKEFGEEYETALVMADLVADYVAENGAILNNQVKKKIYEPAGLEVSAKDKQLLKELIEEGHAKFNANKMDNFRTLYYIGEDFDEEYEKSYGKKSD